MKLTIPTKQLKDSLARLKSIAGRKTTLPILGNILFETKGERLLLTATDLDQQLTITLSPETILREGTVTLPCAALHAALGRMQGKDVALEVDAKHTATIRCGPNHAKLLGLPAVEFPEGFKTTGQDEIMVTGELLGEWLKKTLPAVSTDTSRYVLNGVHFTSRGGRFLIEVTDGRRMVIITTDIASQLAGAVLPTDAAHTLRDLAGESEIALSFSDSFIEAHAANWRLISKRIEGVFPNTVHLIPAKSSRISVVESDRAAMVAALEFAEVFAKKDTGTVRIHSAPGRPLRVTAENPQGDGETEVPGSPRNAEFTICANVRFLIEMLGIFDTEKVAFELVDAMSPIVVEDGGVFAITMPMRIA